jgi:hypothetical protein
MEKFKNKLRNNSAWLLLLLPLAVYFYFGLTHLTQFETADEHYWMYSCTNNNNYWENNNSRIWRYWDALKRGDWKMTRINDKPGITLAYVSGIGSYLKKDLDEQIFFGTTAPLSKIDKAEKVNFYFRLPLLIFNGLFSLVLFYLIKKLTKRDWLALLATTFILLSPILLGISQIVNPDSLLWLFSFSALLAFLIFLEEKTKKYAILTALFLGLALLSKYSSIILVPFFFVVMLANLFENIGREKTEDVTKTIKKYAFAYFAIIFGALLVYAVLLPDNLVNFEHFMKGSLGFKGMQAFFGIIFGLNLLILLDAFFLKSKVFLAFARNLVWAEKLFQFLVLVALPVIFATIIANTLVGNDYLELFRFPFDSPAGTIFRKLDDWQIFLMQFQPLLFSLSPFVLIALGYAWVRNIGKSEFRWVVFVFSFFVLVIMLASVQQKIILSVRYSIMLYPVILTLAAVGIYQIFSLEKRKTLFRTGVFLAVVLVGIFTLGKTSPFYFNYTNFLLPEKHSTTDAWGYGGYEAAQYLNALPGAETYRIWADYNGVCVFFNGFCEANNGTMEGILERERKKNRVPEFDYFISTRRGKMLGAKVWSELEAQYSLKLDYEYFINNDPNNFIKIYKVSAYEK